MKYFVKYINVVYYVEGRVKNMTSESARDVFIK